MNRSLFRKFFSVIALLLFGTFAWVQYNDIDPEIYDRPSVIDAATWLIFYAFIALLFAVTLFRVVPKWLLVVAVVCCLIQLGRTAPGMWENLTGDAPFTLTQSSMSSGDPRVELSREFLGALLALGGVVALGIGGRVRRERDAG